MSELLNTIKSIILTYILPLSPPSISLLCFFFLFYLESLRVKNYFFFNLKK